MNELADLLPLSTGRGDRGQLIVAGHDLTELAKGWGTPLYVIDAETIRSHAGILQNCLTTYAGEADITYAAKAYFSLGFARKVMQMGLGVDVVSRGELEIARKAGFLPDRVHLHGNNKSEEELSAALEWGIHCIVVDSLDELDLLEQIAARQNRSARIWLRVTPGVGIDTHPYLQTATHATKFGLPISGGQAGDAVRRALGSRWLHPTGLHMHLGSQISDRRPYAEAIDLLVALAEQEKYIPTEISPGGGWGVPYRVEDEKASEKMWIETLSDTVQKAFGQRNWPLPRLIIEPGRWLAARAGLAIYTVGAIKIAGDGACFVSVDGGMADNPRPALYRAAYTALLVDRPDDLPVKQVSVAGRYCESGDVLISDIMLPEVKRGDLLAVPVAGAYQLSLASNYNLAPRPAVLWLEPGRIEVLQKRERPEENGWWVGG